MRGNLGAEIDQLKVTHAKETEQFSKKSTVAELKQRPSIQNKELHIAREESSALKKEFNQLATLLVDRTSGLKGTQSFLTTADAFHWGRQYSAEA